jgi:hypothetical protein
MRFLWLSLLLNCLVAGAEPSLHAATIRAHYVEEKARATNDANEVFVLQVVYPTRRATGINYLLKFDADGKHLARRRLGRGLRPEAIHATADGDLCLTANLTTRGVLRGFRSIRRGKGFSAAVIRLDSDLQFRWAQGLSGGWITYTTLDSGTNLAIVGTTLGEVSIGGLTATNNAPSSAFRAVINPQGEAQSLWITDQSRASVWATLPRADRIYIAGYCNYNPVSFGGGITNFVLTNTCAYVASYSLAGEFQWAVLLEDGEVINFNEIQLHPTTSLGGAVLVQARFGSRFGSLFFMMVLQSDGTVLLRNVFTGPLLSPSPRF